MKQVLILTLILASSYLFIQATSCTLGSVSGCDTAVANGLSKQIAHKLGQMGYHFKTLNGSRIHCHGGCFNMLQTSAADSLYKATLAKHDYITLNSAWRSAGQQYLLYNWYLHGRCGIPLAAKPGTSNHEGGRAIDTSYYNYWRSTLESHGWKWFGSRDVYHFDYHGATNLAAKNLVAFQKLWNQHNSHGKIAEDGIYGPATASALSRSPCGGW
eukprot:TRINITY_DN11877_c0_g1_i1.p1 TRINITY_DN11877_c0_g1~~TRINITY_DN11877_c0_g1_i1.p1  ORF type:complete len:226 (-),score=26.54 TRINITY_DN11877_c0_g1_i1:51-692(-)